MRSRRWPSAARWCRVAGVGLLALVLVGVMSDRATAAPLGYRPTALVSVTGQLFYPSVTGNPLSATDRIAGDLLTRQGNDIVHQAAVFYVGNRTVRVLHPPGSSWASAVDINSRGQVTGTAHFYGADEQTYLWTSSTNTYQLLGSLGGPFSRPAALNDSGVVVGQATTRSYLGNLVELADHAFISDPAVDRGKLRDLGTLPGDVTSGATGVNSAGEVVGYSEQRFRRPFLWNPTTRVMSDLGHVPGDNSTWASDINDRGYVVGASRIDVAGGPNGYSHGFVYSPTTHQFRTLPSRPGYSAEATAINYHGIIVGTSGVAEGAAQALIWNACGTPQQILAEGGFFTGAYGINRHEHVVGAQEYDTPGVFWRRNDGPCLPQALVAR